MYGVHLEPVHQVQRRGVDRPVENLVDLEEEGDVPVQLPITESGERYEEHAAVKDREGAVDAVGDKVVRRGEAVSNLQRRDENVYHLNQHEID